MGSIRKDPNTVSVRFAFCFADTYEIGMSHLGMKILYGLTNAQPNYACERVFCPDTDMEQLMLEHQIPLYTLESLEDRKSTRLNSSHASKSRMPSSA